MLPALATTLLFAITPVFANRAAGRLGSCRANLWRLAVATIVLGIWAHAYGIGLHGAARGWFVLGGVVGFGIGGVAMFQSLPRIGSNLSTLIVQCGSAIVAAIVEWAWLGTRLTAAQASFAAITVAGIGIGLLPTALSATGLSLEPTDKTRRWSGVAWAGLSAAGQGIGAVLSRKAFAVAAAAQEKIDPGSAAYQRALGGLAVAFLAVGLARALGERASRNASRAAPWVIANALTGPVLGVTCFQWALRTTPAAIVQPVVAAAPLLTIPWARWLEGQRPRAEYYVGAILAVVGVTGLVLGK